MSGTHTRIRIAAAAPSAARRRHCRGCGLLNLFVLATLVSVSPALCTPAHPQAVAKAAPETRRTETVAPGVERIEIRRGDFWTGLGSDRWVINVLVLDPSRTRLTLGRAHDKIVGTETTSSIASRHGALAATNGGYFRTDGPYRGEPAGIVLRAGRVLSEPSRRRPGLAVANRGSRTRLAVVDVDLRTEVAASWGARLRIDGINRPRLANELILFTPEFDRTTMTGPEGTEAIIERSRVVAILAEKGDAEIPRAGWVLSAHGTAASWIRANLRKGARLELRTDVRFSPCPAFPPEFIIGGGPRLVRGGKPAAAGDPGIYGAGFADARHPRTAAGVRADGRILLVTVDGRQPERSVGMTIAELTALLIELGAVEAINMDGGGSTTMAVRGRVVNSPSDLAGERPVGDAILVMPR